MKTLINRFVPVFVFLGLGLGVFVSNSTAQPGNSYGLISKNLSDMNFELPVANEKPNMVILVFDSATCSYEFVVGGEMKLIACHYNTASASSNIGVEKKVVLNEAEINMLVGSRISEILKEEVDQESEMALKDWMMSPDEWIEQ